jgi:transmembrane sensor
MTFRRSKETRSAAGDPKIAQEATEWLVRLQDADVDPEEPYPDPLERQNAFIDWLKLSPAHVRAFMEMMEVERRFGHPDPQRLIKIQELLEANPADVIQLYDAPQQPPLPNRATAAATGSSSSRIRKVMLGVAAVLAVVTFAAVFLFGTPGRNAYATAIGEQRTCKLDDGSVVILNTDTRVEVDFSKHVRNIQLIKGEALFIVEHDVKRPFIVSAGSASVRAVGTEFNVRRRAQSTEVAVVEGVVQVSSMAALENLPKEADASDSTSPQASADDATPPALKLAAGERARVTTASMTKSASHDIEDVLSWRERRLVFRDSRLADVAAEFNRYNHTQIRVEGSAAQDMQLTGIFDADHPQAIVLFAQKYEALSVEPDGDGWVVRSRE